jgi:F-type H+-transporting ATPase subunit b
VRALRLAVLAAALGLCGAAPLALAQEPAGEAQIATGEHGAAEGHEGGHHGLDIKTLGLQLLNFGVLVTLLVVFGGKAINKTLASRHEQLKKDLDEASQARLAAEARLKEQEKRLANLEQEVTGLRASIKVEAEREQALLVAAAEEKAKRIGDETRFLMEQQVKEAELRFRDEVAGAAVRIAEEMVKRSVQIDDEQRLAQGFVADVERPGAEGRP